MATIHSLLSRIRRGRLTVPMYIVNLTRSLQACAIAPVAYTGGNLPRRPGRPAPAGLFFASVRARAGGRASRRVVVFLDYQNAYHRARDAFCAHDAAAREGQVDPLALGRLLAGRVPGGRVAGVRLYRGRPSKRRDPRSHSGYRRQTARQVERGEGLVTVISRDLRYPPDWPRRPAQEKGIDVALAVDFVMMVARGEFEVGILFSSDTDLVPALEAVLALRPQDSPACEVAAWAAPGVRPRSLSVRGASIRRHLLSEADFRTVADHTNYTCAG
jgi:uncharacterized LabA/DUF88 family protein